MIIGKRRFNSNQANKFTLSFTNQNNKPAEIVVRAYNDGVAFRYFFPSIKSATTVSNDITSFNIPGLGTGWLMTYGQPGEWSPSYESNTAIVWK